MKKLGLLSFIGALGITSPALAFDAHDAADCAAFSMGNWDFEESNFSKEDQSPEWKSQAGGFVLVAERLGLSRPQVNSVIRSKRNQYKTLVTQFVSGAPKAQRPFEKIAKTCDKILDKAPEMKPYK